MATTKWTHVYDLDNSRKYVGFFMSEDDAKKWVKGQKGRDLEVSDSPPERKTAIKETISLVDEGLDAALAAAKEASNDA